MTAGTSESRIEAKLDALLVTTTRIDTQIGSYGETLKDHEDRLREHTDQIAELKAAQATAGRFTWGDVLRVVGGLAAGGALLSLFVGLVIALAPST